MTWVVVVLVVVAVGLLLRKKKKRKPAAKSGWHIEHSPGMPSRPTPQGAGWAFDFPTDPASHVHYVQNFGARLAGTITVRFTVTGGGFVPQEFPDGRPATVSLLIQRKGDDWGAVGPMAAYRWFSRAVVNLAAGEHTLTVPLDVSAWGDVYGGQDAAAFAAALRDVESLGLVFGSDGGRGHGVYATEPSTFTLL